MQRIPFAMAMFAVAFAVVSLCGMQDSNSKQGRQAGKWAEISLNRSLQVSWDGGTTFAMQWNDACKKLIFDGYPICHATPVVYDCWRGGGRVRISDPVELVSSRPAPNRPDEYSFDVQNIAGHVATSDSTDQDGRIHYGIEWDDSAECFLIDGRERPANPDIFIIFVSNDERRALFTGIHTSFDTDLDRFDGSRNWR
jgi:hypothetical protein